MEDAPAIVGCDEPLLGQTYLRALKILGDRQRARRIGHDHAGADLFAADLFAAACADLLPADYLRSAACLFAGVRRWSPATGAS
jgi:hypothetical protein